MHKIVFCINICTLMLLCSVSCKLRVNTESQILSNGNKNLLSNNTGLNQKVPKSPNILFSNTYECEKFEVKKISFNYTLLIGSIYNFSQLSFRVKFEGKVILIVTPKIYWKKIEIYAQCHNSGKSELIIEADDESTADRIKINAVTVVTFCKNILKNSDFESNIEKNDDKNWILFQSSSIKVVDPTPANMSNKVLVFTHNSKLKTGIARQDFKCPKSGIYIIGFSFGLNAGKTFAVSKIVIKLDLEMIGELDFTKTGIKNNVFVTPIKEGSHKIFVQSYYQPLPGLLEGECFIDNFQITELNPAGESLPISSDNLIKIENEGIHAITFQVNSVNPNNDKFDLKTSPTGSPINQSKVINQDKTITFYTYTPKSAYNFSLTNANTKKRENEKIDFKVKEVNRIR